jgi:hypothetical protein
MRSKIFSLVLAPALLAAVALTSNSAKAETGLKVPFSFTVAGKTCPAGVYTVRRDSNGNFVTLRSTSSRRTFLWMVGPGSVDPTENHIVLKFDQSGNTHALRSIQYGSMVTSRLDGKSADSWHASSVTALGQ